MSNIFDYLDWRGDLTLDQSPFNAVDNLILSCVSYIRFEGIVPVSYTHLDVYKRQGSDSGHHRQTAEFRPRQLHKKI